MGSTSTVPVVQHGEPYEQKSTILVMGKIVLVWFISHTLTSDVLPHSPSTLTFHTYWMICFVLFLISGVPWLPTRVTPAESRHSTWARPGPSGGLGPGQPPAGGWPVMANVPQRLSAQDSTSEPNRSHYEFPYHELSCNHQICLAGHCIPCLRPSHS